jgi:hypothetical protein
MTLLGCPGRYDVIRFSGDVSGGRQTRRPTALPQSLSLRHTQIVDLTLKGAVYSDSTYVLKPDRSRADVDSLL